MGISEKSTVIINTILVISKIWQYIGRLTRKDVRTVASSSSSVIIFMLLYIFGPCQDIRIDTANLNIWFTIVETYLLLQNISAHNSIKCFKF